MWYNIKKAIATWIVAGGEDLITRFSLVVFLIGAVLILLSALTLK